MNNPELQRAWQIIENTGTHLFLTGKAGTGKTTFLRNLKKQSPKRMIVVAPTGIAAINAGGVTIHSFFQLPFAPFIPDTTYNTSQSHFRFSKEKINIIRSIDLLVIDEISMVRADLLDAVDSVLRRYRDRYKPFGGVQLLMIGDLQQLAPVIKDNEWKMLNQYYETAYFFGSRALGQTSYATIELQQVYRQSDPVFLTLLNNVRENKVDEQTLKALNSRFIPNFKPAKEEGYIRLTTHNHQAQLINEQELSMLPGSAFSYKAEITGDFSAYSYPTDEMLTLKNNAQIMFIKNDHSPEKRYYNGMIGEICSIDKDGFSVRTKDSDEKITVIPEEWTNSKYVLNEETKEITEEVLGVFKQYPVKTAWAITIHKSQGLTFEHAIIDAQASFAHGQAYVALSRCKTLEGMVLSSPLAINAIISDAAIDTFSQDMGNHVPDEKDLQQMQQSYFLNQVSELFNFSPISYAFSEQSRLIDEHFHQLFPRLLAEYKEGAKVYLEKVVDVSYRFHKQYEELILQLPDYNTNREIQSRIMKGAAYFAKELELFIQLAVKTSLNTDNKELRKKVNSTLENFWDALIQKSLLLEYINKKGFHINEYLRQKAYIALNDTTANSSATPKEKKERAPRERKKAEVPTDILHPELYRQLAEWRAGKAKELNMPVYVIIQQKALMGIVNLLPDNAEALEAVPYFGPKGVENYGVEILGIIRAFMKEHNLQRPEIEFIPTPPKIAIKKENTKEVSFRLFKEGKTVDEIAQIRQFTTGTIIGHLSKYVFTGDIELHKLISQDKVDRITNYLHQNPSQSLVLKEIKMALEDDISYNDINLVIEVNKREKLKS